MADVEKEVAAERTAERKGLAGVSAAPKKGKLAQKLHNFSEKHPNAKKVATLGLGLALLGVGLGIVADAVQDHDHDLIIDPDLDHDGVIMLDELVTAFDKNKNGSIGSEGSNDYDADVEEIKDFLKWMNQAYGDEEFTLKDIELFIRDIRATTYGGSSWTYSPFNLTYDFNCKMWGLSAGDFGTIHIPSKGLHNDTIFSFGTGSSESNKIPFNELLEKIGDYNNGQYDNHPDH